MADDESREKPGELVRCRGPKCPSRHGRVLFRIHRGVCYVQLRLRAGEVYELAVYGLPISGSCPSCGHPWINPDAVASDGLGGLIDRTIQDIAARVDIDLGDDHDDGERPRRSA